MANLQCRESMPMGKQPDGQDGGGSARAAPVSPAQTRGRRSDIQTETSLHVPVPNLVRKHNVPPRIHRPVGQTVRPPAPPPPDPFASRSPVGIPSPRHAQSCPRAYPVHGMYSGAAYRSPFQNKQAPKPLRRDEDRLPTRPASWAARADGGKGRFPQGSGWAKPTCSIRLGRVLRTHHLWRGGRTEPRGFAGTRPD